MIFVAEKQKFDRCDAHLSTERRPWTNCPSSARGSAVAPRVPLAAESELLVPDTSARGATTDLVCRMTSRFTCNWTPSQVPPGGLVQSISVGVRKRKLPTGTDMFTGGMCWINADPAAASKGVTCKLTSCGSPPDRQPIRTRQQQNFWKWRNRPMN